MENTYVLAMYDIRSKQEFIYRSNHIKEIVGGSLLIRDCFREKLYSAAKEYRNRTYHSEEEAVFDYRKNGEPFSVQAFEKRMKGELYLGEVIYDGGGNFFVLYREKRIFLEINKIFTRKLLDSIDTLKVISTCIEGVHFDDYSGDKKRLEEKHRLHEAREGAELPALTLPFTKVDDRLSMPIYKTQCISKNPEIWKRVSRESYYKYKKYWEEAQRESYMFGEWVLDNMVTKKGEESLLAIVYIDGNNMRVKVQECLRGMKSYEESIQRLRDFSGKIQKDYITDRVAAIESALQARYDNKEKPEGQKRRFVIYAGDEITFICNARDAYRLAMAYLKTLPEDCSACAGISIFHSHAPYADAYRIAEECCEAGKKRMREEGMEGASLLDIHYCRSGIGIDLETIRKKEEDLISRPWFVKIPKDREKGTYITTDDLEKMVDEMNKIARTNIKSLAESAKEGLSAFKMDLKRIEVHSESGNKPDFALGRNLQEEQMRRLVYEAASFYDLEVGQKRRENQCKEGEKGE